MRSARESAAAAAAFVARMFAEIAGLPPIWLSGTPSRRLNPRDNDGARCFERGPSQRSLLKASRRGEALRRHREIERDGVEAKYLHAHARRRLLETAIVVTGADGGKTMAPTSRRAP